MVYRNSPRNRYDALESDPLRKKVSIRTDRTETEQMFDASKRLEAYARADQLYDNDNVGSTLDTTVRLTVGTKGGTPVFLGDGAQEIQEQFDAWKKHAGYSEGESWQDLLQLVLRTVKLHGDCIVYLDHELTGGKIRIWDADQIVNIHEGDFLDLCRASGWHDGDAASPENCWRQVEGVVVDTTGQVKGYFVTMKRNQMAVSIDDATFLPAACCRRVSYHKKHTQYRGEPLFLPNSNITDDTRSLIASEVQAAKINAELAFLIKRPKTRMAALFGGLDYDQATDGTGVSTQQLQELEAEEKSGTDFSALSGHSAIGYIPDDNDVVNLSNSNRPAPAIQQWMDKLDDANGKRLGVMSLFSRGRADNSYSSGQIEMAISWAQFEEDQKVLERQLVDYVCETLWPGKPYQVIWPKAFEIDPQKAEQTRDIQLRGGRTDFEEMLGPYWRKKLLRLAEQKRFLEEQGLTNLSFFQSGAGNALQPGLNENDEDNANEQDS